MDVSGGYDWAMARDACAPRDLCSTAQLCDGQQLKYQGNISWNDNIWLPVSDDENVWRSALIQYRSGEIEQPNQCKTWQEVEGAATAPSWGNNRASKVFKHTTLCCLGNQIVLLVPNFLFQSIAEI